MRRARSVAACAAVSAIFLLAAAASFELGADQYPVVEGIGDRAYTSQPIGDIAVLAGRHEISVALYFDSDDDQAELDMAVELATLIVDRLG